MSNDFLLSCHRRCRDKRAFDKSAFSEHIEPRTKDGPLIVWPCLRVVGCVYNPKVCSGEFYDAVPSRDAMRSSLTQTHADA